MRFEFFESNDKTFFKAILENDETIEGIQAQSPYPKMKLLNNILEINYVSKKKLHPDIIAAICITCFYPWIKYSAKMPFPVSKTFARGLEMDILPQHEVIDGIYSATKPITIRNVNEFLQPYIGGSETVTAYGGGMDSTAIALLFPEFPLIHSSNLNDSNERKNVMKQYVKDNLKNDFYVIDSNCKELTNINDFTTFTNIFLIPLILSADLNIKNICCGEILESSCMSTGVKYFPQFDPKKRNRWIRFYKKIGFNMFSPTGGLSSIITADIVYKHDLHLKALYCEINKGDKCHNCIKCFRKGSELLKDETKDLKYWNGFNKQNMIKQLSRRPLPYANTVVYSVKNNKNLPDYFLETVKDLSHIQTDLFNRIYSKSFIYFPEDIKDKLISELTKYADLMTEEEEKYLESWDLTK